MKNHNLQFLLFSFLVFSFSCEKKKSLTVAELNEYSQAPENGLVKTIEANDIDVKVFYRPKELIIAQEKKISDTIDVSRYDSIDYFLVRLSKDNMALEDKYADNPMQYNEIVGHMSKEIGQDFSLRLGAEEFTVVESMYIPSFGAMNYSSVLLTFKSALYYKSEDFDLVYNDSKFGIGISTLNFNIEDILSIPTLRADL
jgi:hypothetical protein